MAERFSVFFVVWVILGVGAFAFFTFNKDTRLKRKVHPWLAVLAGCLFILFTVWTSGDTRFLWVMIPMVALITFLNMKQTKFCDSCGATLYSSAFWASMQYCQKCAAKLDS